jgi:hypothetical protein
MMQVHIALRRFCITDHFLLWMVLKVGINVRAHSSGRYLYLDEILLWNVLKVRFNASARSSAKYLSLNQILLWNVLKLVKESVHSSAKDLYFGSNTSM